MTSYHDATQTPHGRPVMQGIPQNCEASLRVPDSANDSVHGVHSALFEIFLKFQDVCGSLETHQCSHDRAVAFEQAYHQETRKVKQVVDANKALKIENGELFKEREYFKQEFMAHRRHSKEWEAYAGALRTTTEKLRMEIQQDQKNHELALSNAADRITQQDKKIDELNGRICEIDATNCWNPSSSPASSNGKRQRLDETDVRDEDGVEKKKYKKWNREE